MDAQLEEYLKKVQGGERRDPDHLMLQSSAIMALLGLRPLRQQKEMEDAVCS